MSTREPAGRIGVRRAAVHHRDAAPAFEPFTRWRLETNVPLPEDQVMRHARILGYGMLDLFASSTTQAWDALERGDVAGEIDRRADVATEDGRDRCWRLLEEEFAGDTWVGGYFDVLPAVDPDPIDDPPSDAAVGLGLVGGFVVDPPYED